MTTLIDFYGYPPDAPGRDCHPVGKHRPDQCVRERAAAMRGDIGGTWLPFIMLHEFEALVIAAGSLQPAVLGDEDAPKRFDRMIREAGGAERINDGQQTAPAKRVEATIPDYRKAQDSVAILQGVDLGAALALCPGFERWTERLRG